MKPDSIMEAVAIFTLGGVIFLIVAGIVKLLRRLMSED
jgi:predicted benzoate:H+ symporter BenE